MNCFHRTPCLASFFREKQKPSHHRRLRAPCGNSAIFKPASGRPCLKTRGFLSLAHARFSFRYLEVSNRGGWEVSDPQLGVEGISGFGIEVFETDSDLRLDKHQKAAHP
jgi:hypothetical protein